LERRSKPKGSEGLTLIEVAIVLVIIGLLIGFGAGLISMLTKRAKIIESRETVDSAVEALISYAAGSKCLTEDKTQANVRKTTDAWNQPLFIRVADELLPEQCSISTGTICDRKSTSLTVKICSDPTCTSYQPVRNVAFVVASKGPNYNLQIMNETNEILVYTPGLQVDFYSEDYDGVPDPDRVEEFDDIVKWVTLDELRVKMACPGAQLRIITTELPLAYQNRPYSATIYAEGGVKPLNWSSPTIPPWLSCNPSSDTTAYYCSGTPSCPGSYTLTVSVVDNPADSTATRSYTINVQPDQLRLTPVPGTTWYAFNGSSFTATINAAGGYPTYTFTCSPSTCSGLTCTCSSTECTISGTANISGSSSETCSFTISASDNCPGSSRQTVSGTYYVVINPTYSGGGGGGGGGGDGGGGGGGGGPTGPPTCTLSVSPPPDSLGRVILSYNSPLVLIWSISNGPANYNFSPQSGGCTFGSNSNGGICLTAPYTRNVPPASSPPRNFTLFVANSYGSGSCTTNINKICVENSARAYRVVNFLPGRQRDFRLPDGTCRRIRFSWEITTITSPLRPGTRIEAYSSASGRCTGAIVATFSYNTAVCIDDNGDGWVNMTGNEIGSDR